MAGWVSRQRGKLQKSECDRRVMAASEGGEEARRAAAASVRRRDRELEIFGLRASSQWVGDAGTRSEVLGILGECECRCFSGKARWGDATAVWRMAVPRARRTSQHGSSGQQQGWAWAASANCKPAGEVGVATKQRNCSER
ncbi:hypothetical protein G7Y89_g8469 [Cudoniella acicularis]|uniref:Uncharacterized protein n=1 Tax=Cudoniella acicularis TaxID=354080 RepID=A0A8H4RK74_9HELO|nr:hypothetical protein G7Y89_g8469 [Cudoniella acicularis]